MRKFFLKRDIRYPIVFVFGVVLILFMFIYEENSNTKLDLKKEYIDNGYGFELASDPNTHIIYIENYVGDGCYIYTPYYSKNGKLCRFEDERIVEIKEEYEED